LIALHVAERSFHLWSFHLDPKRFGATISALMKECLTLIYLFAAVVPAKAAVVFTSFGSGADTYVQATDATSPNEINFGVGSATVIKNPSTANRFSRKSYLRFDLTGQTIGMISEATLSLTVQTNNLASGSFTVSVYGLKDGVGENWIEGNGGTDNNPAGEIVWSNAPANAVGSGINFTSDAALLGTLTVASTATTGTRVTFASNPDLLSFLNADTDNQVTFMLARAEGGSPNLAFYTKEFTPGDTSDEPALALVPEPSSSALLGLGCLMLLRRRRN
jgi:hypothetical protein